MSSQYTGSFDIEYIEVKGVTVIVPSEKEIAKQIKSLRDLEARQTDSGVAKAMGERTDLYESKLRDNRAKYAKKIKKKTFKFRQYSQMDRLEAQMAARVEWKEDEQPKVDMSLLDLHILSACTGESVDSLKNENHVIYDVIHAEVFSRNQVTLDQLDFFDTLDTTSESDT